MLHRLASISIALLIGALTIVSCGDSTINSTDGNPPSLPPERSMAMDFSNFNGQNKALSATIQAKDNFSQAAFHAGLLKVIVDINLIIPRTFLKAASDADVQFNESKEWEWDYSSTAESNEYSVRLTASRDQTGATSWNFYVTNSAFGLEDKLFFSGVSYEEGTKGSWSYYSLLDSDGTVEKISQIEWTINNEDDLNLRLDVVSDRNDNMGDYIDYTLEGATKTVVYYDAGENKETTLQWDMETHVGFVIAPEYNNGQKACWDENFEDVPCSE